MTTSTVNPSKAKAWWALIIPLIGSLTPTLAQLAGVIPAPWGAVLSTILALFAAITGTTVHQVSYLPPDTQIVPSSQAPPPAPPLNTTYQPPWPKP